MQSVRSEASKVDQPLIICCRASFSDLRHISTSFWLFAPLKPSVTRAATWQVSWMLTVGTCARAASANAKPVSVAAITTASSMIGHNRSRAVGPFAVEAEAMLMRASGCGSHSAATAGSEGPSTDREQLALILIKDARRRNPGRSMMRIRDAFAAGAGQGGQSDCLPASVGEAVSLAGAVGAVS